MVDIDREVVELCRKHLPAALQLFDDPRVELLHMDARRYLDAGHRYDIITAT